MTTPLILAIGVALAFAALSGYLVWRLDVQTQRGDAQTQRGDREVARRKAIAAQNKRLGQVARNRQRECLDLAQIVRESEAAYAELQDSLKTGGWVRLPSDEELHEGVWP